MVKDFNDIVDNANNCYVRIIICFILVLLSCIAFICVFFDICGNLPANIVLAISLTQAVCVLISVLNIKYQEIQVFFAFAVPKKYRTILLQEFACRNVRLLKYIKIRDLHFYQPILILHPDALGYIKYQSEEICMFAVTRHPSALYLIKDPVMRAYITLCI